MPFEEMLRLIVREELINVVKAEFDRRGVGEQPAEEFWDSIQAAQYLKIEEAWLRCLARNGRVTAHKALNSNRWKFLKKDLDEYLLSGRRERGNGTELKGSFFDLNKKFRKR